MTDGLGSRLLRAARRRIRRHSTHERGVTLVEVLITIVILGLIVTSMMSALTMTVQGSSILDANARAEAQARRAEEWLRAQPYQTCNTYSSMPAATDANNVTDPQVTTTVMKLEVTTNQDWDGSTWVQDAPTQAASDPCKLHCAQDAPLCTMACDDAGVTAGTCTKPVTVDYGLQRITIQVDVGSNPPLATRTFTVIKRTETQVLT